MSNSTPETKICTKCKRELPATAEYFHKHTETKDKLRPECIDCVRVRAKIWREQNKERLAEEAKLRYKANSEPAKERARKHREQNRDKKAAQDRAYYEANKDKKKEYDREYRKKNPEKVKFNTTKWRKENPEKRKEIVKRWEQNNKDYTRVKGHNYRAKKRSLPHTLTPQEWEYCLEHFHYCCAACGRQLKDLFGTHTANADHWIPLSNDKTLGTVATNIIPLCGGENGCNQSKGNRNPQEWLEEKFGKRKAKEILKRVQAYFDSLN